MIDKNLLNEWEQKIQPDLMWSKVEDIPEIPFTSFRDAQQKIRTGEFATGMDFTTANQIARWLYGDLYRNFFLFFASAPIIIALVSVVLTFTLSNYWLLLGVLFGFVGQFTSNPYNPAKGFFGKLVFFLLLLCLWSIWVKASTITILTLSYVIPFWMNRWIYRNNQKKLTDVALQSEPTFIYLYQKAKMGLQDSAGKSFWHTEAVVREMDDLLKKYPNS